MALVMMEETPPSDDPDEEEKQGSFWQPVPQLSEVEPQYPYWL
jgi:hypothetical protein